MEENELSIMEALYKNSGMQLEEWITMIKILDLDSRDKIVKFLMEHEGLTYRTSRFIAYKAITKLKH